MPHKVWEKGQVIGEVRITPQGWEALAYGQPAQTCNDGPTAVKVVKSLVSARR